MKRAVTTILISLVTLFVAYPQQTGKEPREGRSKVAVVLSGGGAKGASHVGVLKVLEEYGIPIDIITGTSMGALIGGLYSVGHSAAELDSIIVSQDWDYLISGAVSREEITYEQKTDEAKYQVSIPFGIDWSAIGRRSQKMDEDRLYEEGMPEEAEEEDVDPLAGNLFKFAPEGGSNGLLPMGLMAGQKIYSLLSDCTIGYHDECNFGDLPIPYACVATDLVSGKEIVFDKGILPMAMRASMAIPGVFPPVKTEDMVLVDGGMKNNFPVDVARAMGADIVIGVKPVNSKENADLDQVSGLLEQLLSITTSGKIDDAKADCDILLLPETNGKGTMSFDTESLRMLIDSGEQTARAAASQLLELKMRLAKEQEEYDMNNYTPPRRPRDTFKAHKLSDTIELSSIRFVGINQKDEEFLIKKFPLSAGQKISISDIESAVNELYSTKAYSSVVYTLGGDHSPFDLTMTMVPARNNRLGVGIRFDTEEISSILLDFGFNYNSLYGNRLGVSARLAGNYRFALRYSYLSRNYTEWDAGYQLGRYSMPLYSHSKGRYNMIDYLQNSFEAGISTGHLRRLHLQAGLKADIYYYRTPLNLPVVPESYSTDDSRTVFAGPFLSMAVDDMDNVWFPTRGVKFDARLQYFSDISTLQGNTPFLDAALSVKWALPLGKRVTFMPFLYSRALVGNDPPVVAMNCIGGTLPGRYSPNQIPFYGSTGVIGTGPLVAVAGVDLRGKIYKNHYLLFTGNYVRDGVSIPDFIDHKGYTGFRLGYAYDFVAGPLEVDLGWNDLTQSAGIYLSFGYWF